MRRLHGIRVGPKVGPLLVKRVQDTKRHRGEGQVTNEAEVGIVCPQAEEH